MNKTKTRYKLFGFIIIIALITSTVGAPQIEAQDEMIYKGYLYEGDHLLLGETAAIQVTETQKNITGGYGALIAVTDRGKTQNDLVDIEMESTNGGMKPNVDKNYLYPGDELDVELEDADITLSVLEVTSGATKITIKASEYIETGKIPQLIQIKSINAPREVEPGQVFETEVKVKNQGTKRTQGINLALNTNYTNTRTPFLPIESSTKTISYLDGKEERTITFKMKANENLPSNNYPLAMKAIYLQNDEQVQRIQSTAVKIKEEPDRGRPQLQTVEIPDNIEPGDKFNLTLNLRNKGLKNVKDLEITKQKTTRSTSQQESPNLSQQQPTQQQEREIPQGTQQIPQQEKPTQSTKSPSTSTESGEVSIMPVNQANKQYISIIKPYRSKEVTYTLKASEQISTGVHPISFSLDYESDNKQYRDEFQVGALIEGEEDLEIVDTDYSEINPGDEDIDITGKIQNLGTRKAKNIIVKPIIDKPFNADTDQDKQIGSLDQDEKGSIKLELDVNEDIDPGEYEIPLEIDYTVNNERKQTQKEIKVKTTGEPELEVIDTEYDPSNIRTGEKITMIATIKNTGEKEIESVSFQGVEKVNQPVSYNKDEDFIGSLDPGETAEGALELEFDGDAIIKTYQLETMIRGVKDEEVYTFTENPKVTVDQGSKGLIQRIMDILPLSLTQSLIESLNPGEALQGTTQSITSIELSSNQELKTPTRRLETEKVQSSIKISEISIRETTKRIRQGAKNLVPSSLSRKVSETLNTLKLEKSLQLKTKENIDEKNELLTPTRRLKTEKAQTSIKDENIPSEKAGTVITQEIKSFISQVRFLS